MTNHPGGTIQRMPDAATTALPAPHVTPLPRSRRSLRRGAGAVILCSLLVTAAAALVALVALLATDARWSLAFVIARWLFVAALLATPLVHQVATRLGATWRMPWALQTPATALLLTCESIAFDIVSAQLH